MEAVLLNEIIEKTVNLKPEERQKLIQVLQEQESEPKTKGGKGYVSPNTIWVRENSQKYKGMHIALKDGELIATGKTIKEADLKAKDRGVKNPLLHYIPAEGEEVWGGW